MPASRARASRSHVGHVMGRLAEAIDAGCDIPVPRLREAIVLRIGALDEPQDSPRRHNLRVTVGARGEAGQLNEVAEFGSAHVSGQRTRAAGLRDQRNRESDHDLASGCYQPCRHPADEACSSAYGVS